MIPTKDAIDLHLRLVGTKPGRGSDQQVMQVYHHHHHRHRHRHHLPGQPFLSSNPGVMQKYLHHHHFIQHCWLSKDYIYPYIQEYSTINGWYDIPDSWLVMMRTSSLWTKSFCGATSDHLWSDMKTWAWYRVIIRLGSWLANVWLAATVVTL